MNLKEEIKRKLFHILLIIFPTIYCLLGKWQSLMIIAPITLIIVGVDYFRKKNFQLNKMVLQLFSPIMREHEKSSDKLCGLSFVLLAACINFAFFKKEIVVASFLILAISDSLAALVGKSIRSKPFFEKSLAGSAAFFASALLILIGCGIFFDEKAWFYIFGFFAVFCVTMFEARPSLIEIDDNFAIPVGFAVILTFFDLAWNYNY
jgi:dolichol kinase